MTKTWEEEVDSLEDGIKTILGSSFTNEKERVTSGSNIFLLTFVHKSGNDKIIFELVNWGQTFIEISVQKKKSNNPYNIYELVKHSIFSFEQQNEVLKTIQAYKKGVELRNLF